MLHLLFDQGTCGFQVSGVEALGEPAVGFGQHLARLRPSALSLPEASQTRRGAQLERLCLLPTGQVDRLVKAEFGLRLVWLSPAEQQLAPEPMELRVVETGSVLVGDGQSFG